MIWKAETLLTGKKTISVRETLWTIHWRTSEIMRKRSTPGSVFSYSKTRLGGPGKEGRNKSAQMARMQNR
jgi:hypothetical protein